MARKYVAMRCFRFTVFGGKIIHNHTMKWKKYDLLSQVWGGFGFGENPLERHWRLEVWVCNSYVSFCLASDNPFNICTTVLTWMKDNITVFQNSNNCLSDWGTPVPSKMDEFPEKLQKRGGGDNLICFVFWMDILAFKSYSGNLSLVCGWGPPKNNCFFRVGCHRKTLLNHQLIFRDMRLRFYWMFHLASAVLPTLPVLE